VTEAMLLAAAAHGPIGMITFGSVSAPLYSRLLARHGFTDRVARIETIEIDGVAAYLSPGAADAPILGSARRLIEDGAAAIVICGVANIGAAMRLQPWIAVPVFDSLAPSIASALVAIQQAAPPQAPRRPISTSLNLSAELSALIAGAAFAPVRSLLLRPTDPSRKEMK
jgi:Asp/Glu/hydantoin racemase